MCGLARWRKRCEVAVGKKRYQKAPYSPPEVGRIYSVRDKAGGERIIRIKAKNPDGTLVDDFYILTHGNTVHVLNAPSPAATASIVIGEAIVDRVAA